jgi:hypothetical protein
MEQQQFVIFNGKVVELKVIPAGMRFVKQNEDEK